MNGLTQTSFDFNRADRRGLLDNAAIPSGLSDEGRQVAGKTIKALLRLIDDCLGANEWAWPSQKTLAKRLGCSNRTIRGASEAAIAMGLLIREERENPYGSKSYQYKIVWSELAVLAPAMQARRSGLNTNQRSSSVTRPVDDPVERQPSSTLRSELALVRTESVRRTWNEPELRSPTRGERRIGSQSMSPNPPEKEGDILPNTLGDIPRGVGDSLSGVGDILARVGDSLSPKHKENINRTPPPPLKPTEESSWREVEEEIFCLGVVKASECIASARMAGVSLTEIRAIIDRYLETMRLFPTHWTAPPFILLKRIQCQRPGFAIDKGWIGGLRPQTAKSVQYERSREHSREHRQALLETIHRPNSRATADDPEWRAMLSSLRSARIKSQ